MSMTLDALRGRVMDVDSHEMVPTPRWHEAFGDRGQRFVEANAELWRSLDERKAGDPNRMTLDHEDTMAMTAENVWAVKECPAPGAIDMNRRPALLDVMGVRTQLVFPTMGLFAFSMAHGGGFNATAVANEEQRQIALDALDAYNEWAGGLTSKYPQRLRIVGVLASGKPGLTPESMVTQTERLISTGVRAVFISSGMPPAGLSPAHPLLDPFYATLAEANVALVLHPPAGAGFRKTDVWGRVPGELRDLSAVCSIHAAEENFLAVMTMGGVFERHPTLRLGIIEAGASWIGPLAERMDVPAVFGARRLPLKPSEYLARNVRVSALLHEPVEVQLERYPMIQDVYCYSSDYPHVEGGQWSLQKFYERVAPLGDDLVEKFFCTNAELLLP